MDYMLMPLRRYADFQGRSRRKEYWMFVLGYILLFLVVGIVGWLLFGLGEQAGEGVGALLGGPLAILFILIILALLVPSVAVQVRRFHDQDKSGWLVLLGLIPYIGGIIVLVFMCLEGTRGPNRFGPDPKNPDGDLNQIFS